MAQEPVHLDYESKVKAAKVVIKSGLKKKGRAMLRKLRSVSITQKLIALRPLYSGKLDAEGARLLAETRTSFIEDIEKRNNAG